MHNPEDWPVIIGPAATRNVSKLILAAQIDRLERSCIQANDRFENFFAKIRSTFGEIIEKLDIEEKKNTETVAKQEMGQATGRVVANNASNTVQEIKKALEAAFAEERPKKMSEKDVNAVGQSEIPLPNRMVDSEIVFQIENDSKETRALEVSPKITSDDDYTVQPMDVEQVQDKELSSVEKSAKDVKNTNAAKKLKRRSESVINPYALDLSKRMKTPQANSVPSNAKNGRNPSPVYFKKWQKAIRMPQTTNEILPTVQEQSEPSETDDNAIHANNSANELEIKREVQDAIDSNGMSRFFFHIFFPRFCLTIQFYHTDADRVLSMNSLIGSIAENAKIVFKALEERRKSKSVQSSPLTDAKDEAIEDEFGDILFQDDE